MCGSIQESDTKAYARKNAFLLRRIVQASPTPLGSLCGLNQRLGKPQWLYVPHLPDAFMVSEARPKTIDGRSIL
jgi:hypothetical protein